MAQPYTVMLPGGGSMTVNANSPDAARENAGVGGSATVVAGGHQTISNSSGQTVVNPNAHVGAGEIGRAPNAGGGAGAYSAPTSTGIAADGKSLAQQDQSTKDMFVRAYGSPELAAQGWAIEHNTALGVGAFATPGTVATNTAAYQQSQANTQTTTPTSNSTTAAAAKAPGGTTTNPATGQPWTVSAAGASISGTGTDGAPANLVKAVTDYYNATMSGNKAAADEAIKEFNQNYDLMVSATTGTFNGSPTQAALKQAADIATSQAALTGTLNGVPTLAAERQASDLAEQMFQRGITTANQTGWTAQGQATLGEQQLGLDALKATAAQQNDPFRQQQYMQGLAAGGYSRAIDAMNGNTAMPSFQGPQGPSAAGTNTMGYLGSVVGGYAGGGQTMGAMGSPMTGGMGYNEGGQNLTPEQLMQSRLGGTGPTFTANQQPAPQAPSESVESLLAKNPSLGDPAYQQVLLQSRGFVFWPGENLGANGRPTTGQYPNTTPAPAQPQRIDPGNQPAWAQGQWGQGPSLAPQQPGMMYAQGGGSGSPMGTGMSTYNASLNALPNSANQIVGANYLKAPKATQNFITSGMSAKTGLDQDTIDQQIRATMPQFKAPSFGLSTV